ncbi:hypothetical protein [Tautonia rosea]|uniref:hypothetical protein n=1 Tax=Tautonia rosea TaxID=2728037 RepID=UPI001472EF08|nr:hypothetical protein [Tautonia rosea]
MNLRDVGWPPRLQRALQNPSTDRDPWSARVAGALISGYLWVAFTDAIATTSLAVGGLVPAITGAAIGGLLACVLLFLGPSLQGLQTRQPLMVVASAAFGIRGSALVPGLLLGLVQMTWFAVAVHYAVEFNLRGLLAAGLINPRDLRAGPIGSPITQSTVYAATAMLWAVSAALVSTRFIRWIAALMIVYPIFIALSYAGAMVWSIPGLPSYRDAAADPINAARLATGPAFWGMVQYVFGFSAIVSSQAVNWGATLNRESDVRKAGAVGVGLASTIIATIALLIVAGSIGRDAMDQGSEAGANSNDLLLANPDAAELAPPLVPFPRNPEAYRLGTVLESRIGGILGGIALIVLGLGSLASAVYAAYAYSNRLESIRKRPRRWAWGVVGAVVAYPLMVTGLAANVPLVIDLTAGMVAPMLGVLTAAWLRHRTSWPGPAPGICFDAMIAWGAGSIVGLLPVLARVVPMAAAVRWLPMALLAYLVAIAIMTGSDVIRSLGKRSAT